MRALILCSLSPHSPPLLFLLYSLSLAQSLCSSSVLLAPLSLLNFLSLMLANGLYKPSFLTILWGNRFNSKILLHFEILQPSQGVIEYE